MHEGKISQMIVKPIFPDIVQLKAPVLANRKGAVFQLLQIKSSHLMIQLTLGVLDLDSPIL